VRRVLDEVRWTLTVVALADVAVVALACVIALAIGSFERGTVGLLVLAGAGLVFLMVVGSLGGFASSGGIGGGFGGAGMAYTQTLHAELHLQHAVADGAARKDLQRRRLSSAGLVVIGFSLLIVGFAVVG
jgi:hypothetical protein